MLSRRAPLFSVSLAFAIGCLLGLDGIVSFRFALAALALSGLVWWRAARHDAVSLAAFYVLTVCAGLVHTLLLASAIAPDDVRRLPEEKTFSTTQWRGFIVAEPVVTPPGLRSLARTSFVLRLEAWRPTGGRYFNAAVTAPWRPAQGDVRCTLIGPAPDLQCGDELEAAMALNPISPPLSPGQLDGPAYEAESGIYAEASMAPANWRRTGTGGGDFWQNLSYRARDWAYGRMQIGLEDDPRIADFLAGMLIGYRQQIPADIEQDFRRTGTLHVFAVSGQNIAELMVVAIVLLQLGGFVRWRWAWVLAPIVMLYCLLTGSPASAVRAAVMALLILLAWRLGRPLNGLGCWSLALLAMLVWNPALLFDPGAQLSFGVVLGLILLSPPLARLLRRPFARDPFLPYDLLTTAQRREETFWNFSAGLLGATLAATLVSEPITAVDFHQVTPVSVLANLVVVPTAGFITVVGTLSVLFSLALTLWAALLNNVNWLLAHLLIAFVGFLAREPGASLNVPDVRTLGTPLPSFVVDPVQDSACLLVRTARGAWLFNTGREIPARAITQHLLQFYGVNQLDGLALAQMSAADNSGADLIIAGFHPRRLVIPVLRTRSPLEKALPGLLALSGRAPESWREGRRIDLGPGVDVDVLLPSGGIASAHAEDRGLVLLFHAGGGTLLWAGKIDPQIQKELAVRHPDLRADILVLSADATPNPAWLQALGVREWLQIPVPDRDLNTATSAPAARPVCRAWPLDQTGAVEIHFAPAHGGDPAMAVLRPWTAPPASPEESTFSGN